MEVTKSCTNKDHCQSAHFVQSDDWHELPRSILASDVSAVRFQNWRLIEQLHNDGNPDSTLHLARASSLSNSNPRRARAQRDCGRCACVCMWLCGGDPSVPASDTAMMIERHQSLAGLPERHGQDPSISRETARMMGFATTECAQA